jgi:hypothetical protein
MQYGTSQDYINQWNELNPTYRIRSLLDGAWFALDKPDGMTEHYWTADEAVSRGLELKVKDRPSLKELTIRATAQIIHINEVRNNA